MKRILEWILKTTHLYYPVLNWRAKIMRGTYLRKWERAGRPVPPPHAVKHLTLSEYGRQYGLRVFIETGTFRGDMVEAMKGQFDKVISIELSREFYEAAKRRFRSDKQVEILCGDSANVLGGLIQKLDRPALFWLDGHYSGGKTAKGEKDTPILEELDHILSDKPLRSVIVIDDARDFGREPSYPSISDLRDFVLARNRNVQFDVRDDMIRVTPF